MTEFAELGTSMLTVEFVDLTSEDVEVKVTLTPDWSDPDQSLSVVAVVAVLVTVVRDVELRLESLDECSASVRRNAREFLLLYKLLCPSLTFVGDCEL